MSELEEIQKEINFSLENAEDVKKTIAQNITFFRKRANLTQTQLAKLLKYSNKNISKWEQAETTPDIYTLKKLAKIFGISIDDLTSPITDENKNAIKTKNAVPMRYKVYILSLVISIIFLLTCVAFYTLKTVNIQNFNASLLYLYALPVIDLTIFIFCCCIKKKVEVVSLSLFGWLVVLCCYITFIKVYNIGYVFVLAVAYQILAVAFARLVNTGKIVKFNKKLLAKLRKNKNQTEK